jgi:signal transduction histidine kinase
MSSPKTKLLYVLAWIPAAFIYTMSLTSWGTVPSLAIASSIISVGWAAVVSLGVWWLTGRIPWNERAKVRFVLVHVALSVVFGVLVAAPDALISAYVNHKSLGEVVFGRVWSWATSVMSHGWLYGLVAGVSYSIRTYRRLRDREIAAARAEAAATRAQLIALRAQLRPHFLFNSLHSLSTLVRHDPARAEQALEHLGDMLRYALDDNAVEDVPLGDEWAFVQHYIGLEALRLGDRLRVSTDLTPEALEAVVPCFTLQPLVENAIRHGIAPVPRGGTLRIGARVESGLVVIEVNDDGNGADVEAMAGAEGLGLKALRQRIDARYPGAARVSIETAPGKGFTAIVTLPRQVPALA